MLDSVVQSKVRQVHGGVEKEFEHLLLNEHAPRPPPAANG